MLTTARFSFLITFSDSNNHLRAAHVASLPTQSQTCFKLLGRGKERWQLASCCLLQIVGGATLR